MRPKGLAISLFSGAGGLDLGVEQAGFQVAAAVEIDLDAADTMEKNFHGLAGPVIREDIREVSTKHILKTAGLKGRERPVSTHWWTTVCGVFKVGFLARLEAGGS